MKPLRSAKYLGVLSFIRFVHFGAWGTLEPSSRLPFEGVFFQSGTPPASLTSVLSNRSSFFLGVNPQRKMNDLSSVNSTIPHTPTPTRTYAAMVPPAIESFCDPGTQETVGKDLVTA